MIFGFSPGGHRRKSRFRMRDCQSQVGKYQFAKDNMFFTVHDRRSWCWCYLKTNSHILRLNQNKKFKDRSKHSIMTDTHKGVDGHALI